MEHWFDLIMIPMQVFIFLFTIYYFIIGFCGMWRRKEDKILTPEKSFAVIVAAHNESAVIGQLLENLYEMEYPKTLYDVFVVADFLHQALHSFFKLAAVLCSGDKSRKVQGKDALF